MEYAVRMQRIEKSFSGISVLKGVDFELETGEIHALVGENGAGKSTLIKVLSGAIRQDSGLILVNGREAEIKNPLHAKKLGIQTIYQELTLVPDLSIADNIFLGSESTMVGFVRQKKMNALALEIMSQLGLTMDVRTPVKRLGIGMQFFTEICRCLVSQAKIVIMDEPTSAMSPVELNSFLSIIRRLRERGISIIYISHRLEEIFQICDRVTVLRDGMRVDTCKTKDLILPRLVKMMIGKDFPEHHSASRDIGRKPGKVLLEARNLTNGRLKSVSFSLHEGEILGVTGLLGAGKSELARALFGADRLDGGELLLNGKAVVFRHPERAMKERLAMVPEDRKDTGLLQQFSIKTNLALVNLYAIESLKWFVNGKKEIAIASNLIQAFNVKCHGLNQKVSTLSGGNQQKLVLAKWIHRKPRILLLDEPTRGIDVGSREEIYRIIRDMAGDGMSIVVFSSEIPEIIALSDRIVVMRDGAVSGEMESGTANQESILLMATGGLKWN